MAAAAAMRCEHSPDGGIHLLQVKHWFCFIGRCPHIAPPHPRMVVEIVVDLPAFLSRRFPCWPQL
jgi:hypothetical protein